MILLISMAALLLFCVFLIGLGGRGITSGASAGPNLCAEAWPTVALVVPATGTAPYLSAVLQSFLSQDYPSFQIVLVTRDPQDPATPVIRKAIDGDARARLVHAGRTTACSQKNRNLLAGMEEVGGNADVVVFCDSTRIAGRDWLKALVRPLLRREVHVTSGYYHVIPGDDRVSTLARACAAVLLHLTRGVHFLNQPWGGGTAIQRETWETLKVRELWAQNIVDDVSLAAHLKRHNVRIAQSPDANLSTPLAGETFMGCLRWLHRQWFYLKVCLPWTWLAAGFLSYFAAITVVTAGVRCGLWLVGAAPGIEGPASFLFLVLVSLLACLLRRYHPCPGPAIRWILAGCAVTGMAALAHGMTCFSNTLTWQGIRYRVGWGGLVEGIEEAGRKDETDS